MRYQNVHVSSILCHIQNTYLETTQHSFQLNTSFHQFSKITQNKEAFNQSSIICSKNRFQTYGAIMALAGLFVDCT